ncbi:MAG: hypothetical protein AAB776_03215 [Patescibacteria group bacterium]
MDHPFPTEVTPDGPQNSKRNLLALKAREEAIFKAVAYRFAREYEVQEGKVVKRRKCFYNLHRVLLSYLISQVGEARCDLAWYDQLCGHIMNKLLIGATLNDQDAMSPQAQRALDIIEMQDALGLSEWLDQLVGFSKYYEFIYSGVSGSLTLLMTEEGFREGSPDWAMGLEALQLVFLARLTTEGMMRDYHESDADDITEEVPISSMPKPCPTRGELKLVR